MSIFTDDVLKPPKDNEFEITIFGNGYGESIITHLPKVGWGIIDSCEIKTDKDIVIPPLAYLTELYSDNCPRLAFVLLTHPHEDHYKGFDKIINCYPGGIERICRYHGDGIKELRTYWVQQKAANKNILPGLHDVFNAMEKAIKSGVKERRLAEMTTLVDLRGVTVNGYGSTDIKVIALSPTSHSIKKYTEVLFAACPEPGMPVIPVQDRYHNLLSVSLLLQIGKLQVILGADVEDAGHANAGWQGILLNADDLDFSANLVKVAHHGSKNGFDPKMWCQHHSQGKPIALISPYCRGSNFLPDEVVISYLKDNCDKVGLTGSVDSINKLSRYYRRDVVTAIAYQARAFNILEYSKEIGFLRVRLLLDGTIIESMAQWPAVWL